MTTATAPDSPILIPPCSCPYEVLGLRIPRNWGSYICLCLSISLSLSLSLSRPLPSSPPFPSFFPSLLPLPSPPPFPSLPSPPLPLPSPPLPSPPLPSPPPSPSLLLLPGRWRHVLLRFCTPSRKASPYLSTRSQAGLATSFSMLSGRTSRKRVAVKNVLKLTASIHLLHTDIHAYIHACMMHTYMHVCIYTYIHAYIHTHIHTCIHAYMHTYIHSYIHTRTYIHAHTYTHTYIHTCMHTCMHTYMHLYICIYIYIERERERERVEREREKIEREREGGREGGTGREGEGGGRAILAQVRNPPPAREWGRLATGNLPCTSHGRLQLPSGQNKSRASWGAAQAVKL